MTMRIVEIIGYDEEVSINYSDPLMQRISDAFTTDGAVKRPLGFNAGGAPTDLAQGHWSLRWARPYRLRIGSIILRREWFSQARQI